LRHKRSNEDASAGLVASKFSAMFGGEPRIFRAPGRVNLIGEHTDYNDGFVMPAAIGFHTWIAASIRNDREIDVYSDHYDERASFSMDALAGPRRKHWSDFIRGVAATLQTAGYEISGANLCIHGDVPLGAGLSSSASLEVACALALTISSGIHVPQRELVKLCQKAEHEFVGTRCGVMDPFIASFGAAGCALRLDCRSLEFELLPIAPGLSLVVCNSMVRHELASGEYNRRRADCETGVKLLRQRLPELRALRDATQADLKKYKYLLPEVVYRRCRHVVSENYRVTAAAEALRAGDTKRLGHLMCLSHASLREDYEVSCKELDLLVELALSISGVYGARMTGGGFGGCTVNLVSSDSAELFKERIAAEYQQKTGIESDIYICEAAQGAGEWTGKTTE
jgi:galactokinase